MARWTLGSYNRFIGAARRASPDLSVSEARSLYRQIRRKEGKPVFASFIEKHPVVFNRSVRQSRIEEARRITKEAIEKEEREMPEVQRFGGRREPGEDVEEGWEIGGKADYQEKTAR